MPKKHEFPITCKKCTYSTKYGRFLHCSKMMGMFPLSSRFKECKNYQQKITKKETNNV